MYVTRWQRHVDKTPDSQSGKPGSIPGASDGDSCPPLGAARVKQRRRGDERHHQMPGYLKSVGGCGVKTDHSLRPVQVMGLSLYVTAKSISLKSNVITEVISNS